MDSIRSETTNPKIIILGDYNENPNDKNVKNLVGTKIDTYNFHNPFENLFKKGFGTIGYRDQMNLFDQIIMSTNMTSKNYNSYQLYKAGIFNPNYLTTKSGKYKGYPYRSFSNNTYTGGYSDHYPVYIYLIKQNNH